MNQEIKFIGLISLLVINLIDKSYANYCPRMIQQTVNPFNFVDQYFDPIIVESDQITLKGANQLNTVYQLPYFSVTWIYFDFGHLSNFTVNDVAQFNYSSAWQINIFLNGEKILNPYNFLNSKISKIANFEYKLFVQSHENLTVEIEITNQQFYSGKYQFINSTKIQNSKPSRAIYNTSKIFGIVISDAIQANPPANVLPLNKENNYFPYIVSYIDVNTFQKNIYTTENSPYWSEVNQVIIPYLPYFSNCKSYGQYIYLHELMEHKNCTLIEPNDTIAINQYSFGMKPTSDQCDEIILNCMIDEFYNGNPQNPYWFQLQAGSVLFYIITNPIDQEDYSMDYKLRVNDLVAINVVNQIPTGMMPLKVELTLNYFQVDQETKRIISGQVEFQNFYTLSTNQQNGQDNIYYDLVFNLLPLSQADLVNAFALQWPVYLILYIIIGAILVIEVAIFVFYHYVMNRKRPRPLIKFSEYLIMWSPAISGVLLAQVPILLLYILITIIMSGQIWTTDVSYACSLYPSSIEDPDCGLVLFDYFKNGFVYENSTYQAIRLGRSGLALITCSFYIMYILSYIYVPKNNNSQQSYNGNIQLEEVWKKGRIFYATFLIVTLMVMLIQFSFTTVFSINAYYFLIFNKISQMVIEYILEVYFDDNFIASPFAITVTVIVNAATMGNPTFYAFLLSTLIDKGVEMSERAYIIRVQKIVTVELEFYYEQVIHLLKKLLEEQEEDEDDAVFKQNINKDKNSLNELYEQEDDDSDSDIIFKQEFKENLGNDDESYISDELSIQEMETDDNFTFHEDKYENKFKELIHLANERKRMNSQREKETVPDKKEEIKEHKNHDQTDLLEYFSSFSNDINTLLTMPFTTIILWLFYTQSQIMSSYEVLQSQFIYYFLWNLVQIPFQVILDILGYNLVEQYHDIGFLGYVRNCIQRFQTRKRFWKGEEEQNSIKVEKCFSRLDQWCFSSQYYFINMTMICSLVMCILGAETVYVNQYNIFYDSGIYLNSLACMFIMVFWIIICTILHKLIAYVASKLRIWQISEYRIFPEEIQSGFISIEEFDWVKPSQIQLIRIPKWEKAVQYRENMVRIEELDNNLDKEQFQSEQYRKIFLNSNKQWLRENIRILLSPRTLKEHRKTIIDKFTQIYGHPDKKNEADPIVGFDSSWNFKTFHKSTILDGQRNIGQLFSRKYDTLPHNTIQVMRYWLYRTRINKVSISQVGGLIEQSVKERCDYCGLNWGLQAESEYRIEDLYINYLKQKNIRNVSNGKQIDDWQNYFSKNQRFRTVCFVCNDFMVQDLMKDKIQAKALLKQTQQVKKQKLHFKKIAKLIYIWVQFFKQISQQIEERDSENL